MACMTAETGTLIYAIINIIIVTLGFTADLGVFIYSIAITATATSGLPLGYKSRSAFTILEVSAVLILGLVMLCSLITLVFSSLLLDGILKKKPGYVKAYFIYGVFVVVVTMLALIGGVAAVPNAFCGSVFITIIIFYVIYCSILYMIRRAYTNMEAGTVLYEPKPLIAENEYC